MSGVQESVAAKREVWSDRRLLEFFRDRSNLPNQSESSTLTAWEALELSGVSTDTIFGVVQDISGAKIVDVSALVARLVVRRVAERAIADACRSQKFSS